MLTEATLTSLKEIAESLHCLAANEDATAHQKLYLEVGGVEYKYLQSEGAAEAIALVVDELRAELHRRKHGPFTLAEAIASGRPFRRKAWGDDPSSCRLDKDCSSSWFDFGWQTDCIDPDDITATDYELKDGGGDAS